MITIHHKSAVDIEQTLRKIESETTSKNFFISFFRSVSTYLIRKLIRSKLTRIKASLIQIVERVSNIKTDAYTEQMHTSALSILKELKEIKADNEIVFFYNYRLEELYKENIKLAHKFERLVRTNLYKDKGSDNPTDLTIAISKLANKNISDLLYDPKST